MNYKWIQQNFKSGTFSEGENKMAKSPTFFWEDFFCIFFIQNYFFFHLCWFLMKNNIFGKKKSSAHFSEIQGNFLEKQKSAKSLYILTKYDFFS